MSDIQEIVGQDVNLHQEAPESAEPATNEAPETPEAPQEQPQEPQTPEARVVPLAALHEERAKRKELAANLEQLRQEQARRDAILEQRLAALTQARQQEQIPSFDENPAAHLMHSQKQLQQTVEQQNQQLTAWQRQQHAQQVMSAASQQVQMHEAAFVQQAPDYQDAVNHLRNAMAAEFIAEGADPEVAATEAANRMKQFAIQKTLAGQNPAQAAYAIAKARGYAPKPQTVAPTGEQVIKNQQKVASASKTLGGGGAPSGKLTLEALASMSDEDFAEATKGNKWAQIAGG